MTPIEVSLEWEPADVKSVASKFGPGTVKVGSVLHLSKTYGNEFHWESGCDEQQATKNFLGNHPIPTAAAQNYAASTAFDSLRNPAR